MKLPYCPAKDGLSETLLCRSDGSKERKEKVNSGYNSKAHRCKGVTQI